MTRAKLTAVIKGTVVVHATAGRFTVIRVRERHADSVSVIAKPDGSRYHVPLRVAATQNWEVGE